VGIMLHFKHYASNTTRHYAPFHPYPVCTLFALLVLFELQTPSVLSISHFDILLANSFHCTKEEENDQLIALESSGRAGKCLQLVVGARFCIIVCCCLWVRINECVSMCADVQICDAARYTCCICIYVYIYMYIYVYGHILHVLQMRTCCKRWL
jgi:hypothetical protein